MKKEFKEFEEYKEFQEYKKRILAPGSYSRTP